MPNNSPDVTRLPSVGKLRRYNAIGQITDDLLGWQRQSGGIAPNGPSEEELNVYAIDFVSTGMGHPEKAGTIKLHSSLLTGFLNFGREGIGPMGNSHQNYLHARPWPASFTTDSLIYAMNMMFDMRCNIVMSHPEWLESYLKLLLALGLDGTSSDETESDNDAPSVPRVQRIPKTWQNKAVEPLLRHIDAARDQSMLLYSAPGRAGRLPRVRNGDHPTQKHSVGVCGMPENLYDPDWLRSKHPRAAELLGARSPIQILVL
ncbi:hypothetical protein K439DRAFT_1624555 [Ramaria rubella]|nr:hypothetical protein K439DRAFT_1624555 [Ramaria rubella]